MWCCCADGDDAHDLINPQAECKGIVSVEDARFVLQEEALHRKDGPPVPPKAPNAWPWFSEAESIPGLAQKPYREFSACVERVAANQPVGLELDVVGGISAMIMNITSGAAELYNEKASPDAQLQVGDFIVAVNGVSSNTREMGLATKLGTKLDFLVRRPTELSLSLDRNGNFSPFGLEIEYLPRGKSLFVRSINAGIVEEWNRKNPGKEMKVNDRIVQINSIRGDMHKFMQIIRGESQIDLVFVRHD